MAETARANSVVFRALATALGHSLPLDTDVYSLARASGRGNAMHTPTLKEPGAMMNETFENLYISYYAAIVRHLQGLLRDPEQAEDLAQETFARAYKALSTIRGEVNYRPWLYRIATNVAYDVLRRRRLLTVASLDSDEAKAHLDTDRLLSDDPQGMYDGPAEAIRLTLQRMTPRHQRTIILGFLYDYSNEQLAQAFGLKEAKMLRRRARQEFRQRYVEAQRRFDEENAYDLS